MQDMSIFFKHELPTDSFWQQPETLDWEYSDYIVLDAYEIKEADESVEELLDMLQFDGEIFLDSGGHHLQFSDEEPDRDRIREIQETVDPAYTAPLDFPPNQQMSESEIEAKVNQSLDNATYLVDNLETDSVIFGVLHGAGPNTEEWFRRCYDHYRDLGLDHFAVPPEIGLPLDQSVDRVKKAREIVGDDHLHIFGSVRNVYLPIYSHFDVDSMDGRSYLTDAFRSKYWHNFQEIVSTQLEELPCECPTCEEYSFDRFKDADPLPLMLHNLYEISNQRDRILEMDDEEVYDTVQTLLSPYPGNPLE